MNCRKYLPLALLTGILLAGSCSARKEKKIDYQDLEERAGREMVTDYLIPARIVWQSDSSGEALKSPENLLKPFNGQVAVNGVDLTVFNTGGPKKAAVLLDFGKEIQGGIEISCAIRNNKQTTVRVSLGESVSEAMSELGKDGAGNDHAMRCFDIVVPWLGKIEIGNSGFRFAYLELLTDNTELPIAGIRAASKYRDIPYLGSFRCSDKRLEEIWKTGAYTVHLNMQDYLWDGIKRDRLVWLGDMHPEVMTVSTVFGYHPVVNKSLDFAKTGTPLPRWMNGMCAYSLWWLIIQHDWYLYHGNLEYLKAQSAYLNGLTDQLISQIDGNKENLKGGGRFLDWPTSGNGPAIHAGLQALLLRAMESASQIGEWTGDTALAEKSRKAADRLSEYHPDPEGNKQAAALLALSGLGRMEDLKAVLLKGGAEGFSTFYGYYMLEALAKAGAYEEAMQIISDYWGGMLDLGATTFWEDLTYSDLAKAGRIDEIVPEGVYDIHKDGGAYCYRGLRHSFCHGWASGPTSWLSAHVLGIRPAAPGCREVYIDPHLGKLEYAEGTFPTPYGVIYVKHSRNADGTVSSDIRLPKGVTLCKAG